MNYATLGSKCYSSYPALLSNQKFLSPIDPIYDIILTRYTDIPSNDYVFNPTKNDTEDIKVFDDQLKNNYSTNCKSCNMK